MSKTTDYNISMWFRHIINNKIHKITPHRKHPRFIADTLHLHRWHIRHTQRWQTQLTMLTPNLQRWHTRHTTLTHPSRNADTPNLRRWHIRHTTLTHPSHNADTLVTQRWHIRHTMLTHPITTLTDLSTTMTQP